MMGPTKQIAVDNKSQSSELLLNTHINIAPRLAIQNINGYGKTAATGPINNNNNIHLKSNTQKNSMD